MKVKLTITKNMRIIPREATKSIKRKQKTSEERK